MSTDLDGRAKIKRVAKVFAKIVLLFVLLYFFICSLDFLSSAFRLLGGKAAGEAFASDRIISNPVAGLMIVFWLQYWCRVLPQQHPSSWAWLPRTVSNCFIFGSDQWNFNVRPHECKDSNNWTTRQPKWVIFIWTLEVLLAGKFENYNRRMNIWFPLSWPANHGRVNPDWEFVK